MFRFSLLRMQASPWRRMDECRDEYHQIISQLSIPQLARWGTHWQGCSQDNLPKRPAPVQQQPNPTMHTCFGNQNRRSSFNRRANSELGRAPLQLDWRILKAAEFETSCHNANQIIVWKVPKLGWHGKKCFARVPIEFPVQMELDHPRLGQNRC